MKTAAIYARYSCENQTEQSIEGQLRVCQEYAASLGILIVETYIDRAMSGTNDNRAAFQQMLKDSSKKQFQYVIVYKLDRFARNKVESVINKKTLQDNGVALLSAMERITDTPEGRMMETILEGFNQYFSEELTQKVNRGLRESWLKGNATGGHSVFGYDIIDKKYVPHPIEAPLVVEMFTKCAQGYTANAIEKYFKECGYTVIDKKLTIVEDKAKIVRFIFEQYAMGLIVPEIITKLNNLGLMHDGKPFTQNCIYGILKNKRYSGICEIHGVVYDNIYPRIISKEIIDNVQIRLARNKAGRGNKTAPYLLRFKLFCGNCGCPMAGESGTNAKGKREFYYKCYGKKKLHNGCQKQQIRKDRLEEIVLNSIIDAIKDSKTLNTMVDRLFELQSKQIGSSPVLASLIAEKSKTDKALGSLVTAVENGLMSNTTNKRLRELEQLQQKLEEKIAIENIIGNFKVFGKNFCR